MEEQTSSPQPQEAQALPLGEFDRMTGVLFDPKATFPDIVARPRWWVRLVLLAVLTLSFLAVFDRLGGWPHFLRAENARNERFQQLPAEQRESIVTCYSLLPLGINSVLSLVVFLVKGPEEFDLQNPAATNVGAFLDPGQVPAWVVSVASSIDLVSFWVVLLLATGIAAAGRRLSWGRAFDWMLGTWAAWMVVKGLGSWVFS